MLKAGEGFLPVPRYYQHQRQEDLRERPRGNYNQLEITNISTEGHKEGLTFHEKGLTLHQLQNLKGRPVNNRPSVC